MIRYQILNEYGLSDPGLYAPGLKDDPEALLEGVAMAGLVGVLRQLGDLAEFAAVIFHDLHEDVMATASRGHGLMLRLQQLEAEFPAAEKAIISLTDHSNFPHDDGVEWHANLQLNQNMITQGDMPRFILDSYEECCSPPRLFTLDKFDVAGAGASLKRYSDPSFFKTEHATNMIETDGVIEKKPRKIKKKAMQWRKGETLESLLVANSASHSTTSKDRASRKVPPRTTKLKSRHPRDSDHKTTSRICREQLQEVISSQQKILSSYSARQYHAKFRSTDSSEITSSFGELHNFSAPAQSSAKLELTKLVPINEYDTVETASTPINGSVCLEADDGQFLATQHGPVKVEEVCKRSLVEQNGIFSTSEKLQEGPDFKGEESNGALQLVREEKLPLAAVPVNQDVDRCRPDDIGRDQENFVDALNNMESEGEVDHEIKTKKDLSAEMEADKLNCHSKEGENALHVHFSELGPAIDLSSGLNDACNGGDPTCVDSFLIRDSFPSAVPATKDPNSESPSCRQLSDVDWNNDEEPFNDVDLMDVSSSSSVLSGDNDNFETNDNLNGCEQNQDAAYLSSNDYHAAVAHSTDKQSPQRSSGLDGLAISSNDYTEKAYRSLEHGQNFVLDCTTMIFGKPNDVSQDDEEIKVGNADYLLLHPTIPSQEEMQLFKKQFEEGTSLDASISPGKLASLPDMGPVMHTNDLKLDNVAVPEEIVANTTPTGLDPDDFHKQLDELDSGVATIPSSMLNNPLYESHDDEIVEELRSLPDDDLYKHVAEDQEIIALGKGPCSTRLNTHKEDPTQASIVPRDFSNVQELPGLTESVSPPQDDTEAHVDETLTPPPCVLNDDTKQLLIGGPLTSSTASLLDTSSFCVEHRESTEIGKTVECGEVLVDSDVAEESTTSTFEDGLIPCEEVCTDGAKCTEKAEVLATNSREGNSRHDVQLQSSSPCREDLETVEATCENLGSLDESREHIFKESLLQADNLPQLFELETTCETFSGGDDIQYLSSLHFPEESGCQEELPEETNISAEVPCQYDLDKDGAVVSLQNNMVGEQQSDDQNLVREPSAQDYFGTNSFMDPGYIVNGTQTDPAPSMSYQPCFSEEEQDFLSELLTQNGNTGAKENLYPLADSLWEPATPPDEAQLPSEVMTEEDFISFCHEYHEMDFTAVTEGFDNKPSSDSNDNPNGYMVSELEFPCSVSVLPAGLDQEAWVCSKPDPQLAECSSATDIPGKIPFSVKEDPDDETPGVDSDLKSHESLSDEKIPELYVPSVPLELEQERLALAGVDSHSGSCLLDNDKIGEISGSPLGNVAPVKEEQETCANLVPHAFINERLDELDVPLSNTVPVELAVEARVLDEYGYQDIPCSSIDEIDELGALPLSKPVLTQESEVHVLGELDSQIVSSSSINESVDDQDDPPLRTALEVEESEDRISGEHVSQIATSLVNEKMDELDAPPSSNAVLVGKEPEVCVPGELDSEIAPCSLTNEKIYDLDGPPSSGSALVELESEDNVSGGLDSQITPCSSVNDKIDEPDAATSINVLPVVLEQEACPSPELDSEIVPCSLNDNKVGELDGPPSCNVRVKSDNGSYCSLEFDSQIAPCSSNSGVLAEASTMTSTSVMPSTEEKYLCSPVSPPTEPFTNVSYEDPQKPPPLPPLQWRLGRPRLGLLSTKGHMPEPVRKTNPVLPASSPEIDNRLGSLNGMAELIALVSSQEIKEKYQNSMVDNNDQRVELGTLSTLPAVTDAVRTEHDRPFSEGCENIKHHGAMSSSATEAEEHLNDIGVTDVMALHQSSPLLPFPTRERGMLQQGPQRYILSSDTSDSSEHPSHTYQAASEDDKTVDDHNVTGGMHLYTMSSSTPGHVSENGCYQQPEHGESFSETSDNKKHSPNASYDEKNLKGQSSTSGAPSDPTNHTAPGSVLEEGNSHEGQNLQEQNAENSKEDQSEGPSPNAESIVSQDYPRVDHNLEREHIHQPSPVVAWPGDKSIYVGDLDEGSNVHAEQPPVMGWAVGPQMLHPNYGISVEDSRFEPEVTDHRLIRKPISIKNIPRNPLVDAVAAHDRSTMRKVSELVAPTDKPRPNERNLLLEQIRNKTFNLKPVGSAKLTAIRAPARASTRNLKVAAIIEKANAIRQAVGSDDEDGDNWSDT